LLEEPAENYPSCEVVKNPGKKVGETRLAELHLQDQTQPDDLSTARRFRWSRHFSPNAARFFVTLKKKQQHNFQIYLFGIF
jgi:hypothetical protein